MKGKTKEESVDWFRDHEPHEGDDEKDEDSESELSDEELDELEGSIEENEIFNRRMQHFIANQKGEVSLEKILELPKENFEDSLPPKKDDEKILEEHFDYIVKNEEDKLRYQTFSSDTNFSKPDMSSSERILEEQKQLYKHLENSDANMIAENRSEWNPVTPEETVKKNYLTKKKFVTGPY